MELQILKRDCESTRWIAPLIISQSLDSIPETALLSKEHQKDFFLTNSTTRLIARTAMTAIIATSKSPV